MTNSAVLTTPIDQTLFEALVVAHKTRDTGKPAIEDPLGSKLTYKKLIIGAQVLGAKLAPMLPPPASAVGVLLPNSAGVAVTFFALQTIGRVPGDAQFLCRHRQRCLGMQSGERLGRADVPGLRRKGTFGIAHPGHRAGRARDLSGRHTPNDNICR